MSRGPDSLLDAMNPAPTDGGGSALSDGAAARVRSGMRSGARSGAAALAVLDPGWLFLIAGIMLLGSMVIIPAQDDLRHAQWLRDRAKAVLDHRTQRLDRYREYLAAVDAQEPSVVLSLAASQLNQIPSDRAPLPEPESTHAKSSKNGSAMVFPALEPPPPVLPAEPPKVDSTLARWATGGESRLWMIAAGALCLLLGLLPASRR